MRRLCSLVLFFGVFLATPAFAQETIAVEVGKSTLLKVTKQPSVVMVGNPAIADIVIETSGVMFLIGLEPGETNLYMLDDRGNSILTANILVSPKLDRHVTVHRGVAESTLSCNPRCAIVRTPASRGSGGGSTSIARSDSGGAPAPAPQAAAGQATPGGGGDLTQIMEQFLTQSLGTALGTGTTPQ